MSRAELIWAAADERWLAKKATKDVDKQLESARADLATANRELNRAQLGEVMLRARIAELEQGAHYKREYDAEVVAFIELRLTLTARIEVLESERDAALASAEGATEKLKCANDLAEEWELYYHEQVARAGAAECGKLHWESVAAKALARAEAAEQRCDEYTKRIDADMAGILRLQSRLAAAEALLRRCYDELITDPSDDGALAANTERRRRED